MKADALAQMEVGARTEMASDHKLRLWRPVYESFLPRLLRAQEEQIAGGFDAHHRPMEPAAGEPGRGPGGGVALLFGRDWIDHFHRWPFASRFGPCFHRERSSLGCASGPAGN